MCWRRDEPKVGAIVQRGSKDFLGRQQCTNCGRMEQWLESSLSRGGRGSEWLADFAAAIRSPARTRRFFTNADLSTVRVLPVAMQGLRIKHDASQAPLGEAECAREVDPVRTRLGAEEVSGQEENVGRAFSQAAHKVGVPLRSKRNIDAHLVALVHQVALQIAAHSI